MWHFIKSFKILSFNLQKWKNWDHVEGNRTNAKYVQFPFHNFLLPTKTLLSQAGLPLMCQVKSTLVWPKLPDIKRRFLKNHNSTKYHHFFVPKWFRNVVIAPIFQLKFLHQFYLADFPPPKNRNCFFFGKKILTKIAFAFQTIICFCHRQFWPAPTRTCYWRKDEGKFLFKKSAKIENLFSL